MDCLLLIIKTNHNCYFCYLLCVIWYQTSSGLYQLNNVDVFLQTVCCSLAVRIVGKISSSKTNGISWWKIEDCSCLLLSREIRYLKISILYPPYGTGTLPRLLLIADHNFFLIREHVALEILEAVTETMRKKITQKKCESEQSTKTFIFFPVRDQHLKNVFIQRLVLSLSFCSQNVSVYRKTRFTRA